MGRPDWDNQFAESEDERSERLRQRRHAGRCSVCGRNPKIGQMHADDCPYQIKAYG